MSPSAFDTLWGILESRATGWEDSLFNAWYGSCPLTEGQKQLVEALLLV